MDGVGYVGLGEAAFTKTYSDLYSYNPGTDVWTKAASLPITNGAAWPVATVVGSNAFLIGGAQIVGPNLNYIGTALWSFSKLQAEVAKTEKQAGPIFPNPATDFIQLPSSGEVSLFDELGRLHFKAFSEDGRLRVMELPSGSYHYQLVTKDGIRSGAIVKQ